MTLEDRPGFDADEAERRILPPTPEVPNAVAGKVVDRRHGPSVPAKRLPVWRVTTAGTAGRRAAHVIAFTKRAPVYYGKVAVRAPFGVSRLVGGTYRWVVDVKGQERHAQVTMTHEQLKAWEKERSTKFWTKVAVLGAAGFVVLPSAWTFLSAASALTITLIAVGSLFLLGIIGRGDKPAVTKPDKTKLNADAIQTALASLGDARLARTKTGESPVKIRHTGRDGEGWRADIDLPRGVTAQSVIAKRDSLASALRQPLTCVWPETDPRQHAGWLRLWVGDQSLKDQKPKPWPLLTKGTVDLFEPFMIGQDPRGRDQFITLMFASVVVGAQPRMGKTAFVRLLLLAAALDPRAELHCYNMKGGSDYRALAAVCKAYRSGTDPEDFEALVADLEGLSVEMARRYKVFDGLPETDCPEGKVTAALASQPHLRLHPIVFVLEESHVAFAHKKHGARIEELVSDLVRRGPAAGFITICATQRPTKESIPTDIQSSAVLRFALKTADASESNRVLGGNAASQGYRADIFSRLDTGIGYLAGEGTEPVIVRVAYVDAVAAGPVIDRAYAAREAAGRLPGPVDSPPGVPAPNEFLEELAAVWPAGAPSVQWSELGDLLGMPGEQVSMSARSFGIKSEPVTRKGKHARGMYRAALDAALSPTTPPPEEH